MIIEEVILDDFDIKRHLEYILREQNKHLTLKKKSGKKTSKLTLMKLMIRSYRELMNLVSPEDKSDRP